MPESGGGRPSRPADGRQGRREGPEPGEPRGAHARSGQAGSPQRPVSDPPGAGGLTDRQRAVVDAIRETVARRGYPPSMREIGEAVGLSSTSSVAHQIRRLEAKGVLYQDPRLPRAYRIRDEDDGRAARPQVRPTGTADVPVVGRIAAGRPIPADQDIEDVLTLPRQLVGEGELFALVVRGDSMTGAAIRDGDLVAVRRQPTAENGDIVAAMIEGEATVKRLRKDGSHAWLIAHHPAYDPTPAEHCVILGRVVAVLRRL